ncbi:flagellar biosynthesis protein FliQ [Halobacillus litoralis]|uniref:Flagellar biosynthetic protein FliQ n=4 Tax=Halobacillus TaxID=45667 RepID=A0A845E1E1_9BACI|nr:MULTISPECIES: flagellar biosynthesis protein FliQ [Halobacillus]MBN9652861.1 flagellar biosynthesis protein FliQ [Halobacillus sp. GSS1]MBX0356432.1 flagellar biosynthesis protein FliQ [Halobacillus sp. Nhm2S1]MEC3886070.1 flagellar biosynthesis protein FliQ [Halobacillus sp. HZG1]MYL48682.1 flagellar biosynthesis protein FliQ [Halobacillus litoralis]MYL70989.1 flagellar biosynthesis protein FliQ [Halobacillus litoralis]
MNSNMVISFAKEGIYTVLLISGPLLILALAIGLLVSIFQATTQIQEQTLAFIPKIVAVMIGLIVFGPWMLTNMVEFTANIFNNLNILVG